MTFKKIVDFDNHVPCKSPNHNPPTMIVLEPGVYEWTCPDCGVVQKLIVNRPTF